MSLPNGMTPHEFDMALLPCVHTMMHRGIRIDRREKNRLLKEYNRKWDKWQEDLNTLCGAELNVNSSKQVKEWLYGYLDLPPRKYNGKLTTREDKIRNLMSLCHKKVDTIKTKKARDRWIRGFLSIMLILKIRGVRKRISSYLDIDIDSDGRIRCTLSIGGTSTARFSSSKTLWDTGCNLQTIPRELRSMYIPDEGMELAELDLNRGESWIYAHLAEDPTMMAILQEGRDFHSETAAAISSAIGETMTTQEVIDLVDSGSDRGYKLRFLGKKSNHAFAYRMGAYRAAETINEEADDTGITVRVADTKRMRKLWLQKYIAMEAWWSEIEQDLDDDRTLTTPYGRKQTFFGKWGDDLFKDATAYVPQSSSVDYLNTGMLRVYDNLRGKHGLEILHQNHDSILVQYEKGKREKIVPEIVEALTSSLTIKGHEISIPIEVSVGHSWGDLKELEDYG